MNFTCCHKNQWIVPLLIVGVFLASALLFISVAKAADEADIQAAIQDLSSATGQDITTEEQAIALCNQEQYLDVCADIGKEHDLYTPAELAQVDDFLEEIKGEILNDIKSCQDEACLVRVASELAIKIKASNPTLATNFNLTTTVVAEKKAVVEAAQELGVSFSDCEAMDADTAPIDLLRKCAKLAKDARVQRYIPEERRALAQQDDTAIKLREALSAGKYQCGDNTLEGCGNYCLNPDDAARAAGLPAVCKQIAAEFFGSEGVKHLESSYQHVGQVKDYHSQKFILTLPNGRELVGDGQIRNACDQAFSGRNFEVAKACGSFAVKNGFATQAEVDKGLKLMESFTQKGKDIDFDKCLANPAACRDFIPADERERFDVGSQIFEIMRSEIGFDPSQCERGSVDQTIGTKCFEGSKRALAKIEGLGLVNQSREARFIIEEIKGHVSEGENLVQRKDEFRQVFSQQGGPGGCKSEAECYAYCSNPTNGPECIAFGAKQNISGFRGQEAVQKFQEYNQHIQRPGLVSDEFRPYPGQGPYPGFQPPGQGEFPPPGQIPGFTQPGPGFGPPPGPGSGGPSPECLATIQSGDFVRAKAVCYVPPQEHPFPSPQICPAVFYVECPVGQYRESHRNNDGCWVDGPCLPAPTYSPGPYPTYTYSPPPPPPGGYQCSDGQDNDHDGKTDYPADPSCYGPDDSDEYYPPSGDVTYSPGPGGKLQCSDGIDNDNDGQIDYPADTSCYGSDDNDEYYPPPGVSPGTSPYPTYSPAPSCPAGQWWDYKNNVCTSSTPPPSCPSGQWWDPAKNACVSSSGGTCPSGYHYHGESGGFCLNDQENYGGTCYDSAGTSKITCPAQASYTPAPSCPSGQWWDYSKNSCVSSTTTYTPPPSCPSGQWWDTAMNKCTSTATSCATGYYWDEASHMCKPSSTTTYTPAPSCPSGQWWDYAKNMCVSSTTTYTPAPSCPSGQWWDYTRSSCVSSTTTYTPYPTTTYTPYPSCPSGQWWDTATSTCKSTTTTTYTPYPTCASGQYWDLATNSCMSSTTTTYTPAPTVDPATSCASSGGTWNGSMCVFPTSSPTPSPSPTASLYNHYMVAHCQQLGRTWNGSTCQANGLFVRFYENNIANILRLFYIVP